MRLRWRRPSRERPAFPTPQPLQWSRPEQETFFGMASLLFLPRLLLGRYHLTGMLRLFISAASNSIPRPGAVGTSKRPLIGSDGFLLNTEAARSQLSASSTGLLRC